MPRALTVYTSMEEVPPNLGTMEDYRAEARSLREGAPVAAEVKISGSRRALLYHRDHTHALDVPHDAALQLARDRTCIQCGQPDRNRHGKTLKLSPKRLCRTCTKENQ